MSSRLFGGEAGISNLIATLILVAVAVVGGGFAYSAFKEQAVSTTTSADLQVQGLDAVGVGDETVYLSTTVKNVGTQRLTNVKVTVVIGGSPPNVVLKPGDPNNTLNPGQTKSDDRSSDDLNPGDTYPVRITADTPGGGSMTKTMTVRVRS